MADPEDKIDPSKQEPETEREITNANLFADDIVFSNTEQILFEEDLSKTPDQNAALHLNDHPEERYSPNRKLNEGGMKTIWEVDDHRTARKIAMALIQDSKIASEEDIDAFLYEARLTANLQHPNIIPIYDVALDENGNPFFTMKALKGETLGTILKKLKKKNPDYTKRYTRTRLLNIFLKVCNAVDYAHTKGVIHLDLKPSNINVGDFGEVHVLDWGLSTLVTHLNDYTGENISWQSMDDVSLETGQTLTRYLEGSSKRREKKNIVGGTPGYMSPEQAQGAPSDIDFQTDVYMLGALLYEILTYHCPISGETVKEVLQKTVRGEITPPTKKAPELHIPPALTAVIMKAMSLEQKDRYANVAKLIRDIHQFQEGFATSAENPTFITHLLLLIKRHKLAVSLLAASGGIIFGVIAHSFKSVKQSEQVARTALNELQIKNDYIEQTAEKVAPDYLHLAIEQERQFAFQSAEDALNTGLAFDPDLAEAWLLKAKFLLSELRFNEADSILKKHHEKLSAQNITTYRLAKKYANLPPVNDQQLPALIKDLKVYDLPETLPRLFYRLNTQPFDPAQRFQAIKESILILNPEMDDFNFDWQEMGENRWIINMSNNPNLTEIAPLCGLNIVMLTANNTGAINMKLLPGAEMVDLRISSSDLSRFSDIEHLRSLQSLDISQTGIRKLGNILSLTRLASLNIAGIPDLELPEQLKWSQNLKILTLSSRFSNHSIVKALSQRGVIVIYSDP